MGATIRHVAERAGVSISTVSRVLNDTCKVSDDKRKRVKDAAKALGYLPNPAAQSLHSRRTGGLGILLPFVSGEFFAEFLNGVDEMAQQEGWLLLISTSHNSEQELRAALRGMYGRVDGLIIMAPNASAELVLRRPADEVPIVFVNTESHKPTVDMITFDNYGGMREMTHHFLARGHKRIGMICGPEPAFDARERLRGYLDAHQEAGVDVDPALQVPGNYSQQSGHDAAVRLLALRERPTAIMAANDDSAIGALSAIRDAGLRIPEDVALSGFDDVPSARFTVPPLSTVHVPVRELGALSIRLLLDRIADPEGPPLQRALPVDLRIRESS
jgi:LacI family transcriptional regulator